MPRLLLLLAVLSLAFAPAPLPRRPARDDGSLSGEKLAGTWRGIELCNTQDNVKRDPAQMGVGHVTITATQWAWGKSAGPDALTLRIDATRSPAEIDFIRPGQQGPSGRGLIRREGNAIRVLFNWGVRPTSFDNPQPGCWNLKLVRE